MRILSRAGIVFLVTAVLVLGAAYADTLLAPTRISVTPADPALIAPSPADPSIPGKWQLMGTSPDEPHRGYYLGAINLLRYSDSHHRDSFHGIYSVWGKVVYAVPQDSPKGRYQVDIFDVRLNCWTGEVTTLREVRLAPDGSAISDFKGARKEDRLDLKTTTNLSYLPLADGIAGDADDWACGADTPD